MGELLKALACLMLIVLVVVQVLLMTPYRTNLTDDELNGRVMKVYETVIHRGTITIGGLGPYQPNSADILINGIRNRTVDAFPVSLDVCDGDLVEVKLKRGCSPFYVYYVTRSGDVTTDLTSSTVLVHPGINRIFRVLYDN